MLPDMRTPTRRAGAAERTDVAIRPYRKPSRKPSLTVRIEPDGATIHLIGREAWALDQLIRAGKRGCTALQNPGPRWSAYILKLRQAGLTIETIHERHAGPYAGNHARYVLRNELAVLAVEGLQ